MKKKYYIILLINIVLILFDQLTKLLIVKNFDLYESKVLINNFLKLYYIRNTGASFGILSGQIILIIGVSILVLMYLIKQIKENKDNKLLLISGSLIISGAFGNLIDRIFRKYVVDFISFTFLGYDFAVFNVADIFITIGTILYIGVLLFEGKHERNKSRRN